MKYKIKKVKTEWSMEFYIRNTRVFSLIAEPAVLRAMAEEILAVVH